ncbi:MAG: hypothetical protein Q7T44_05790 [Parvibaculum sp.]|nr:hypothetical protein [Parvibaculum sp.]
MQIQVNTDNAIEGHERLVEKIEIVIREGLTRFSDKITRVELHLSDVNGDRGGNDKRCVIEVRPNGLDPVVTSDQADTVDKAVRSAIHKMVSLLDSTFGKLSFRNNS